MSHLQAPIGILGGTFDPIHYGHLRLALELRETLELAELRLLPNPAPPHRPAPRVEAARRAAWVRQAIAGAGGLVLDERELRRAGPCYSVDTLAEIRAEAGATPLCLIMGMDAFAGFLKWREPLRILELAHLVLVPRPGMQVALGLALSNLLAERSCADARQLHARTAGLIHSCSVTPLEISAQQIRALRRAGRSLRYLLPDVVRSEIERDGLYLEE